MPNYRHFHHSGGCYFFTINLLQRFPNYLPIQYIDTLRAQRNSVKHGYVTMLGTGLTQFPRPDKDTNTS
jgi:hypothetical protein